MTVSELELYRFDIPFTEPRRFGAHLVDVRSGVLIRLVSTEGEDGWGEAAPLPGFSAEGIDEVLAYARSRAGQWRGLVLPDGGSDGASIFRTLSLNSDCPPSLQFGLETAVLDVLASGRNEGLWEMLGTPRPEIRQNALVTDLETLTSADMSRLREAGYRAVKAKVGRGSVEAEAETIRSLSDQLGSSVGLRLDANRAWSFETAVRFAEAVGAAEIEYLEEPIDQPERLTEFANAVDVPIALDETTREMDPDSLDSDSGIAAVILKPTLLGGIRATRTWMEATLQRDALPVLSASYEAGIGLRMLVALAAVGPDTPVGLSTYAALQGDVLTPRLHVGGPTIDVQETVEGDRQIDYGPLEQVTIPTG